MAYILKSIAATQFLSNMLFIYFFVNCNIFKFHICCSMYKWVMTTLLLLLVKNWKIINISQTVRDRAISNEFSTHRVVQDYPMLRGKISILATLAAILDFSKKWKSVNISNISKKVWDRAISSEFLTYRVVQDYPQECPMQRGKISNFANFGGHLGF